MEIINQVVVPIGIMIAVTKAKDIFAFFTSKSKPVNSIVEWLVFGSMVLFLVLGLLPRHNIFKELGIRIDTPSFIIKQKMMVYTGPDLDLIDFLSTDIGRQIYYICGNIDCKWCVDKYDYTTYTLPYILFPYVLFLIVAGFCTFDRPTVRTVTLLGTLLAVVIDVILLGYDGLIDIPFEETQYNLFSRIRFYFALLFLIKPKVDTNDRIANLIHLTSETRLHSIKRETIEQVQSDSTIQSQWNKYQTHKHNIEKMLAKDPEIRRKRADLMITKNIEQIKNESRVLVEQMFGEGEQDELEVWE
ncbi:hypothetical protein HK103_006296 [Boothiomyces macroporosus]|uniref:Uncharacterized protein n=1 Tax=Boothiomyces macroporosus TaxID=261099 RepID=A0AAD5Y4P7_9FUNG|nr:hypothetical protein HK103_006296 [Boothiomyces macroporosus]